jgi:hypothetical protein
MDHQELRERLEAYSLGALDADEAAVVGDHLATCDECRTELAQLWRVTNALPAALEVTSPLRVHPSVKRRVLAAIQRPVRPGPFRPALWPVAAVVALVMFVGSTAYAVHLRIEQQDLAVAVRAETLDKLGETLSQPDQLRVLEVLDSNATTKGPLRPVDPASPAYHNAYGKLWTRSDDADVVVMVNNLPQPPAGQHYHLWVTSNSRTSDAGALKLDSDGFALLLFRADRNGPSYQRAVVTLDGTPVLQWTRQS